MSNLIILGDPHFGKSTQIGKVGIGMALNSRIVDQLNLLDWTLDQAIEKHVEHIIITGDIFEEPKPPPFLITLFISWLKKCQVYNVNVHIIIGNHDILRTGNYYSSPLDIISECELDGIRIYKDINTISVGATSFTLVPFRDRKSLNCNTNSEALSLLKDNFVYEQASIPLTYHKVMVGHLAIEGAIPVGDEIDDMVNELFCPLNMFNGYDYVWMGHVHKPQIMSKKPFAAHIGSMEISNFGECDQKKHIVIFDCDSGTFTIENIPTRKLKKISITIPVGTVDSTKYILTCIEKENDIDKSIVKLDISFSDANMPAIQKSIIEKQLLSKGVFNIAVISESKKISVTKKDGASQMSTSLDVPSAIKIWSKTQIKDTQQDKFIEYAFKVLNKLKSESKE